MSAGCLRVPLSAMSTRRPHKKSRRGCFECKKRHVKVCQYRRDSLLGTEGTQCDETRPCCVNCTTAKSVCSYLYQNEAGHPNRSGSTHVSPSPAPATPTTPSFSPRVTNPNQATQTDLNVVQLELLSNFMTETSYSMRQPLNDSRDLIRQLMNSAFAEPYLLYELLAISASHLSIIRVDRSEHYKNLAADLQAKAISTFNSKGHEVDDQTCIPLFFFSAFLGDHVLYDVVTSPLQESTQFLDKFIGYLEIHSGIKVITTKSWGFLRAKDSLKPLFGSAESAFQEREIFGQELPQLYKLIDSSKLEVQLVFDCNEAIFALEVIFHADRAPVNPHGGPDFVGSWPILVSSSFVEASAKRVPESLVILAYFAVLLHRRRSAWLIGDAGKKLLDSISACLGVAWQEWLATPQSMIQ